MNEFNVEDIVRVVSEPNIDCPFFWVPSMDKYLGKAVRICEKKWSDEKSTYKYRIYEDGASYLWCGNCFLPIEDEPTEDIDEVSFLSILTAGSDTA